MSVSANQSISQCFTDVRKSHLRCVHPFLPLKKKEKDPYLMCSLGVMGGTFLDVFIIF